MDTLYIFLYFLKLEVRMYKLTLLSLAASAVLSSAVYAAEQTNATEAPKIAAPAASVEKKDEAKAEAKKVVVATPAPVEAQPAIAEEKNEANLAS